MGPLETHKYCVIYVTHGLSDVSWQSWRTKAVFFLLNFSLGWIDVGELMTSFETHREILIRAWSISMWTLHWPFICLSLVIACVNSSLINHFSSKKNTLSSYLTTMISFNDPPTVQQLWIPVQKRTKLACGVFDFPSAEPGLCFEIYLSCRNKLHYWYTASRVGIGAGGLSVAWYIV